MTCTLHQNAVRTSPRDNRALLSERWVAGVTIGVTHRGHRHDEQLFEALHPRGEHRRLEQQRGDLQVRGGPKGFADELHELG